MDNNVPETTVIEGRSSRSSFDAVIDILPRLSTTKEIWRPPALHRYPFLSSHNIPQSHDRDSVVPAADVKTHYDSHRGESWYELFYDLIFVASAIQIGTIIKYDISFLGLLKSAIIFTVLRATWDQLMFYQNKFDTKDLVHFIFYLIQAMLVFVMAMHLTIDHDHNWDVDRNLQPLAISAGLARIVVIVMYLQVMSLTKKYRTHIKCIVISQGISAILFFLSFHFVEGGGFYYFWVACILIERAIVHLVVAYLIPQKLRAPPHFGHLAHRQVHPHFDPAYFCQYSGTFVLLILGEAIIQLVQSSCGNGATDYLRGLMGFAIVFNVGDVYYQQQVVGRITFLGSNSQPPTTYWTALHLILSIAILFFAVGVKTVYTNDCESHHRLLRKEFLMCISASVSLIVIFFLRMTHKGIWYKGKRVRGYSYGYRFIVSLLCSFIPYFTKNATISIGVLFALTTSLVLQDLFSHGGPREKAISGDHADGSRGALAMVGDIESRNITSGRKAQSGSSDFCDDSFGRDDFVKKSILSAYHTGMFSSGPPPAASQHLNYSSGKESLGDTTKYRTTVNEATSMNDTQSVESTRTSEQRDIQNPLVDDDISRV